MVNNNHFAGQAVTNAAMLQAQVTGERVKVPPTLLAAYPKDGAGATTHGRFYVHFYRPGSDYNDPSMADSMYLHGAFLRE